MVAVNVGVDWIVENGVALRGWIKNENPAVARTDIALIFLMIGVVDPNGFTALGGRGVA